MTGRAPISTVADFEQLMRRRFDDWTSVGREWFAEAGPDLRITYASACNQSVFGETAEFIRINIVGKTLWEISGLDPDKDGEARRLLDDMVARRPFWNFRFKLPITGAAPRHISLSGTPFFDDSGLFLGYRGVAIDETHQIELEHQREEAEGNLWDAIENISEGFVIFDSDDRFVLCNEKFREFYPKSAALLTPGTRFEDLLRFGAECGEFPEAKEQCEAWIKDKLARHRLLGAASEQRLADGRWLLVTDRRMRSGGTVGLRMDISALKNTQDALRTSEERYALAVDGSNDGIWDWNLQTGEVFRSPRIQEILGLEPVALRTTPESWTSLVHGEDVESYKSKLRQYLREGGDHFEHEYRVKHADAAYRWVVERCKALRNSENRAYRVAGSIRDITRQKRAEARARFLAYYDPLTGLANRALFDDRVSQAIAMRGRTRLGGALMLLEISNFGDLIASVGVSNGDALLIEAAGRIKRALRPSDTVGRCTTTMFGILLTEIAADEDIVSAVRRVLSVFDEPFVVDGRHVYITVSMGSASFPIDGTTPETLFRNAATALARVAPSDPFRHRSYRKSMTAAARRRLTMQEQLRRAIDNDELKVFYEPQVDIRHPRIIGAEALARWKHPDLGDVPPSEFIPLAEGSGLIAPLGELVLRKACTQLRIWKSTRRVTFPISVNVSREQLRGGDFARRVLSIVTESGIAPSDLILELTESAILHNLDAVKRLMVVLTDQGINFAIDDFGVEHSALSHLVHLPVQMIKIDRAFVAPMTGDQRFAAVVQAIISMSKVMNKRTVAEGVETEEQYVFLRAYGCDAVQGHLFSRALPAENFEEFSEIYLTKSLLH